MLQTLKSIRDVLRGYTDADVRAVMSALAEKDARRSAGLLPLEPMVTTRAQLRAAKVLGFVRT